ncbi:MAG: class I adenylate-forming enzyme family protein [Congregibacter sp.]
MTLMVDTAPTNLGDCLRLYTRATDLAIVDLDDNGNVEERLTAQDLDERISAVAQRLLNFGVKAQDRALLLGVNSLPYLLTYLALMRMGAVAVPLNPALPRETREHVVRDAECAYCFYDDGLVDLPDTIKCVAFSDPTLFSSEAEPSHFAVFQPEPEDIAEILYTSGSTGAPKGVPLTHHGQCWALTHYFTDLENEPERIVVATPLYHMNGFFLATMALSNRMRIHLLPRFNASVWLKTIKEYSIGYVTGVPTMFALAAQLSEKPDPAEFEHVTEAFLGSSPVSDALVAQVKSLFPKAAIRNSYGTTEAGPIVFRDHPGGLERPPTSVGYPVPDIDWRFSNGSDQKGPLELRTPAVSPGYLSRPEANSKAFTNGWYRTGDIMRRDENGFFYFVGREDDMFVCGGENIYPSQVESLLEKHPAVSQAAVIPMRHATKGQAPAAFVVLKPGMHSTADEIKQFTLENGPAFSHPRLVSIIESMPLGGTRKIDRHALAQQLEPHEHTN